MSSSGVSRIVVPPSPPRVLEWGRLVYHPASRWPHGVRWHLTVGEEPIDLGNRYGLSPTVVWPVACSPGGGRVVRVDRFGTPSCVVMVERRMPFAGEETCTRCRNLWDDLGGTAPVRIGTFPAARIEG